MLVADTRKPEADHVYMARRGRLILDREKQTVDLVLEDGTQYSHRGPDGKQVDTFRFPKELIVTLDPEERLPAVRAPAGHERADHPAALPAGG